MIEEKHNHDTGADGPSRPDRGKGHRLVLAVLIFDGILLAALVAVAFLAKHHRGMLTNEFAWRHMHTLAATLLLLWTLFSAAVAGLFSSAKRRSMPSVQRRCYLALLVVAVPLAVITYVVPMLAGACLVAWGLWFLAEDYCEFRGNGFRWDYRLEHIAFGVVLSIIGVAMFWRML